MLWEFQSILCYIIQFKTNFIACFQLLRLTINDSESDISIKQSSSRRGCRWGVAPPAKIFRKKSQRGDQRKFFGLNLEMFLINVSFGPPFEILIEFRQKSLKNYEKKIYAKFWGLHQKSSIKSDEFTPPPEF
jgi:hypothetical protein